jgi:ketosteroid isomerase-like protein
LVIDSESSDQVIALSPSTDPARLRVTPGIEFEEALANTWTFRDGKIIHFRSYRDPAETLAAAGLSE